MDDPRHCARWVDRLPPITWLVLLGAAIWPHASWMARRMVDRSDDPLGIVALAALATLAWRCRRRLGAELHPAWFGAALVLLTLATVTWRALPPLFSTLLALLAFASGLLALLPRRIASLPVLGLAALSLPVMASLQFYAGYPLRLLVAEASRWLLMMGFEVERDGVALVVDGQLVLVDAACSGLQLVWLAYFVACVCALLAGRDNTAFVARFPVVSALILAGNILRNTALVALQADGEAVADHLHEGVGLIALAAVCAATGWVMMFPGKARADAAARRRGMYRPSWLKSCAVVVLPVCITWNVFVALRGGQGGNPPPSVDVAVERPESWQGHPLWPVALSAVEKRFALNFPGKLVRLTDGKNMYVWRYVTRATRMLHPAADCYHAAGWRTRDERLEQGEDGRRWRCFSADPGGGGESLRICERIEDIDGQGFTDASAWYWAAITGGSAGPWQAMTVVKPLQP